MIKLSAIQLCSTPHVSENLAKIAKQLKYIIRSCEPDDQHLVVLPECCLFFGGKDAEQLSLAKKTTHNKRLLVGLSSLAKQFQVHLVAGTIPLLASSGNKFTNSCCLFSPKGEILTQYDKIHLFDVNVDDSEKHYRESTFTQAGKEIIVAKNIFSEKNEVTINDDQQLNLGLSVCYDLRFAELYRLLRCQGADIITVPSAFTRVTGQAHWQALLQARAIENQVYIIAAGQEGKHANGRETWGHSMIISPWGEILCSLAEGEGVITAPFSKEKIAQVRANLPVHEHNNFHLTF